MALDVHVDRLADPLLLARIRHPVAAEEHLLILERESRDLPAHSQILEQHFVAASPDVLPRGGVLAVGLVELLDRARAQGPPQGQDIPIRIGVVAGLDGLALAPRHVESMARRTRDEPSTAACALGRGWLL